MSNIEGTRKVIHEEALPKAKEIKKGVEAITQISRRTAEHLALAREGIEQHVLPHLVAASVLKEELQAPYMGITQDTIDVRRVARTTLGDNIELSASILSITGALLRLVKEEIPTHENSFDLTEEDTDRLGSIIRRLDLTTQHFNNTADTTFEHISPLDSIIDRLENFEV